MSRQSETDTASTDLVMCHSVFEVGVETGSETDTASADLVKCHSVLEVGVETGSETDTASADLVKCHRPDYRKYLSPEILYIPYK